ncbi:MAG TPA: hypothetical protein VFO36_10970 [Nitrospiraceae bacterium]|nr:hypothetical protein [Nitrospiraceae bacterium]
MKYLKMLGLAAVAAAALMAFVGAGTASATTLTAPEGTQVPAGTLITAEAETHVTLHPPFGSITCAKSHVEGKTSNAGSATETVKGNISTLSFGECNATVTVLKAGSLEIHTDPEGQPANGNGILTSSGAEVTVVYLGFHCIFSTNNTNIGTVTGYTNANTTSKEHATFDISATIPRTGGSSGAFCGSTAQWTGAYTITTPKKLWVD